jgi:hypothetical protein
MNPKSRTRVFVALAVAGLLLYAIGRPAITAYNSYVAKAKEANYRAEVRRSQRVKLEQMQTEFEAGKLKFLEKISVQATQGSPYAALFNGYFAAGSDPDANNSLRTILAAERPGQEWSPRRLVLEYICVATIGSLMNTDPRQIAVDREEGDVLFLSYDRPGDRSHWTQKCRLEGLSPQWGAANGRWQTTNADELLEIRWNERELTVVQHSGTTETNSHSHIWDSLR